MITSFFSSTRGVHPPAFCHGCGLESFLSGHFMVDIFSIKYHNVLQHSYSVLRCKTQFFPLIKMYLVYNDLGSFTLYIYICTHIYYIKYIVYNMSQNFFLSLLPASQLSLPLLFIYYSRTSS